MRNPPQLSILMPVYNEAKTIREIIAKVEAAPIGNIGKQLIIVDDGSTDGTRDVLAQIDPDDDLHIIYHDHNQGKGAAVRSECSSG